MLHLFLHTPLKYWKLWEATFINSQFFKVDGEIICVLVSSINDKEDYISYLLYLFINGWGVPEKSTKHKNQAISNSNACNSTVWLWRHRATTESIEINVIKELQVLSASLPVPPHNISVITNDTRASQIEGDYISLTCSAIGNPRPEITWYREDAQLLDSSTTQIIEKPSIVHGDIETLVTSQLIIKLQYTDHNKNFYCSARNEVNLDNPSKVPFLVQVQCKCITILQVSFLFFK